MKTSIIASALLMVASAASAQNIARYEITDFKTGRDGSVLTVNMNINPKAFSAPLNQRVELVPVIWSADSSRCVELQPVIIAGTNMYYSTLRNGTPQAVANLYRAGKGNMVEYAVRVPYEDWMETASIDIDARQTGCCGQSKGSRNFPIAKMDLRPRAFTPHFEYIAPLDTAEKRFDLSGRANIRFIVNKTNIDWKYANNYVELDSILRTVNAVKDNPDAKVDSIILTGYASPEGPYDNNVRLAKGRVEVVKEYVRNNASFPASVYHTASVPEDWEGLRLWLQTCNLADRQAMIDFIDDPRVPVRTKNEEFMKRFPKDYPFILTNVYPPLRHTDYRITYTVRKYLSVDEIREVFKTRPRNLSLNEMFLLANSYTPGTPEYDEVFLTAAFYYPKSTIANLNAANSAINSGNYRLAKEYLDRAGEDDPYTWYGRGILAAVQGNYAEALPLLNKAKEMGMTQAAEAIEQVNLARERKNGIIYYNYE